MSDESNVDKKNAIRILEYWFLTELLNQESLGTFKEKGNKTSEYKKKLVAGNIKESKTVVEDFIQFAAGDNLQTVLNSLPKQLKNYHTSDYTVFIGCMKKETCIQEIARRVHWRSQNPDAKDETNDEITLAILKFSKYGRFISNSLSISPLAWAMKKLSSGTENSSQKLSIDNYNADTRTIEAQIVDLFNSSENGAVASEETDSLQVLNIVSYDLLKMVENLICKGLNIKDKDMESYLAVYFKLYESENDDENGTEVSLHMDFYSKDLAFVIDGLRNDRFTKEKEKILLDYILGLERYNNVSQKTSSRFDVVKPQNEEALYQFMSETLSAAKAPLGKWPSRFMPALMQQIAVNLATDPNRNLSVFSVNGPPGTGKTTLLKEIIVNNIVEKAILLAEYADPDDAFDDFSFLYGDGEGHSYNEYYKNYHRLKNKKINGYSILVASSNNTAVENITKELPVEGNLLGNIKSTKEAYGPNEEALAELTKLFTVSESAEKIPFLKVWKYSCTNKKGEKIWKTGKKVDGEQPDIYFSGLATELLNADVKNKDQKKLQAWGLISATLGKKDNIDKVEKNVIAPLLDIIGTNKEIIPRKENYLEVRKKFLAQLEIVKSLCKELDKLFDAEKAVAEARIAFEEKERQVDKWRDEQRLLERETIAIEQELQSNLSQLNIEKDKLETEITTSHITCTALEAKVKAQQNNIDVVSRRIEELQKSVSIFGRLFKSASYKKAQESIAQEHEAQAQCQQQVDSLNKLLDEENRKVDSLQAKRNSLTAEISEVSQELSKLYSEREKIKTKGQSIERELAIAIKKVEDQKNLLEKERNNYQNRDAYERGFILDHQFISDILSTDKEISTKAQLRNPWFSERYNREREKLFLYALQMTREFILSSRKCRNNFKHLHCLWSGSYDSELVNDMWVNTNGRVKFIDEDLQNCTAAAYETLFLLIPVVSSTFASVQGQRFLGNAKEEDIVGTLIVDEAGQASPHMAIGALSRSRKAVIVGDPKQVEPVVTDDQDLLKQTYTDDLFKPYKDKTNSVQRFADIMNPYGTYLKNAQGDEEWVGCPLLVHRRCISPMYEISNDISYSNIMKQQTAQPDTEKQKLFIAEKSQWFNVCGKEEGIKRHFVKEQGEKVIKMLEVAFSKNSSPDIFIISPFTTVESGIKDYIEKYVKDCKVTGVQSFLVKHESLLGGWLDRNVGTVHKFQGREAAEVIFLLGCDTSEDAKPAILWVNNNIVNVAATRAKYRFYVIGDKEAWEKSKCVNRAKKIMDSYVAGSLGWVPQNHNLDDGYTLIIAEKLSVAKKYADALCVWNEPSNDFFEGNGYLISWCKGHLFEIATPEQYKKASIEDLPIFPDDGKYQIKYAKDQSYMQRFNALKKLMNRDDVTNILCATDADREGELIFRLVYQQAECKKHFKRVWLSSMEPASIREAFENPKDASDYDLLYEAARCRQLADWIVGMNGTKLFSLRYDKNLSVGRVKSPTLAMIVDREKEIESFVPKPYYTVKLNVERNGETVTFESRRVDTEEEASRIEKSVGEVYKKAHRAK